MLLKNMAGFDWVGHNGWPMSKHLTDLHSVIQDFIFVGEDWEITCNLFFGHETLIETLIEGQIVCWWLYFLQHPLRCSECKPAKIFLTSK
jgi:hypothetical protein